MAYSRNEVVKQAQAWIGLKESNGSHKQIIDLYNSHKPLARGYKVKYTDAWCATFVSAVAIKLGYTAIIPTECGCDKQIALFKNLGSWVENDAYTPSPGDIIYYDWQDSGSGDNVGGSDHVGIVEKVSGNTLTVIEGNKSDAVGRRTLAVNGKFIRGYGIPKYGASGNSTPPKPTTPAEKDNNDLGDIAVDGQWGCATTKKAQQVFGCAAVDGIVSNQPAAYRSDNPGLLSQTFMWESPCTGYSPLIKAIQKKVGATQDGRTGPNTIKAMQRWLGCAVVDGYVSRISPMVKEFQRWLNKQ